MYARIYYPHVLWSFFDYLLTHFAICAPVLGWTRRNAGGGYRRGRVGLPLYSTAVLTLNTLDLCSFASLSLSTFCRTKSYKKARHKFRKSFKALARELLCNITHPPFTCRSCLNVPISGTKELASRTTNIVWRTRSNTFVLFPLLELTLAVAQYHAGFVFKITIVRKNHRAGQPRPYILVNRISLFVKRSSLNGQGWPALLLSPCLRGTRGLPRRGWCLWCFL